MIVPLWLLTSDSQHQENQLSPYSERMNGRWRGATLAVLYKPLVAGHATDRFPNYV